jgi:hypothetical protein
MPVVVLRRGEDRAPVLCDMTGMSSAVCNHGNADGGFRGQEDDD